MSLATTSASTDEELIFYVHEKSDSDEFTFYIDQHKDDTVVQTLRRRLPKTMVALANGTGNEVFSFAERVFVKNLHFTKDSLKWSEDCWINLNGSEAAYKYLAGRIHSHGPAGTLNEKPANPKAFLKSLAQILNEIVEKEDLEREPWAEKDLGDEANFVEKLPATGLTKQQWRNRLILERAFPALIRKALPGRGLICFSYVGRYLSVTFRKMSDAQGYAASDFSDANERKDNLFSLGEYCELLYREIFRKTGSAEHAHGLVVVTGATKSAKSEIARGLIELYLQGKEKSNRRHHLVTFEDPVERFYVHEQVDGCSPWAAVQLSTDPATNSDYTPRQKEKDAHRLQEALNDALRQTPALFFVGETREREEWKVLLDFAATGHLILTTAHAGSLLEAMHRIFEALQVKTAADRSEIANKLLGIVHLRRHALEFLERDVKKRPNALFPALWRRTPRGIAALTCDGLASLLPYRPNKARNGAENPDGSLTASHPAESEKNTNEQAVEKDGTSDAASCLGRRWIVEELITPEKTSEQMQSVFGAGVAGRLKKQACEKATEWDLEGV